MKVDLSQPVPPPESGELPFAYYARCSVVYRTFPLPVDGQDVTSFYRDVVSGWDMRRLRTLDKVRRHRKNSPKKPVTGSGYRSSPDRVTEMKPESPVTRPVTRLVTNETGDVTVDDGTVDPGVPSALPDNVRELTRMTPTQRAAKAIRDAESQTSYFECTRDATREQVEAFLEPGRRPAWEQPGYIGYCPTWFHPSGWVNGVVDMACLEDLKRVVPNSPSIAGAESALVTSRVTSSVTDEVTPDPGVGLGAPPLGGGHQPNQLPVGNPTQVTRRTVTGGGEETEMGVKDISLQQPTTSPTRPNGEVILMPSARSRERPKTPLDADAISVAMAEAHALLRDSFERQLEVRDVVIRELGSLLLQLLPKADRSILSDAVLRFIEQPDTPTESDTEIAPPEPEDDEPSRWSSSAQSDEERMIVHAWDVAASAPRAMSSGQQWGPMRELYRLALGLSGSENQALALFMWWVETFTANDPRATPTQLMLQPQRRPPALPPERGDPSTWPSRESVRRMSKLNREARLARDGDTRVSPAAPDVVLDGELMPESGWDARLDDDGEGDDAERGV